MAEPAVLIAAVCGRALAASARRAGYRPLVADFFGDEDTLALAHAHVRLTADFTRGIDRNELLGALETLALSAEPMGVVCGTGFEDRPGLLADLAGRWRLMGNGAEAVERAKDPLGLAILCRDLGIPHPAIRAVPPADPAGWLAKRRGGAGGSHIRDAAAARTGTDAIYYQRRAAGIPVSALVLANGRAATILGFSTQWPSPTREHPFRYGGAVRPAALDPQSARALTGAVERVVGAMALVGLNSVDFIVGDDAFWLLEINPRPGATLDIFERRPGPLFALHVGACNGGLPTETGDLEGAMAQGFVYAEHDVPSVPGLDWPDWTADRQRAASTVRAGEPLCTVLASGRTIRETTDLLESRIAAIRACIDARIS